MKHRNEFEQLFWAFAQEHPDNCVVVAARLTAQIVDSAIMDWRYILKVAVDIEHGI